MHSMNNDLSEQYMMFDMSNLIPKNTGLKYPIWYSVRTGNQRPGIKVDLEERKGVYISIEDKKVTGDVDAISSKDLNDISRWIDLNKELLHKYWNGAHKGIIDSCDVAEQTVKLPYKLIK